MDAWKNPMYALGATRTNTQREQCQFINPRWSIDTTLDYQKPVANANEDLNYAQYGISLDARRHFRQDGRRVNPYFVAGVGYQRVHEEYDAFPDPNSPGVDKRGYATAKLGVGAQADFQRVSLRGEIAARHGFDSNSRVSPSSSGFTDTLASLTILVPFGGNVSQREPASAPYIPAAPPDPARCMTTMETGSMIVLIAAHFLKLQVSP